jgi:hypothetical protein
VRLARTLPLVVAGQEQEELANQRAPKLSKTSRVTSRVRGSLRLVIMFLVIKISLAEAKAHLSKLVDQAEHKKKRIVILRHGRPAAGNAPALVEFRVVAAE